MRPLRGLVCPPVFVVHGYVDEKGNGATGCRKINVLAICSLAEERPRWKEIDGVVRPLLEEALNSSIPGSVRYYHEDANTYPSS